LIAGDTIYPVCNLHTNQIHETNPE
jgi:hypothetical protein